MMSPSNIYIEVRFASNGDSLIRGIGFALVQTQGARYPRGVSRNSNKTIILIWQINILRNLSILIS